jgi:hypothetical protein
MSTFTLQGHRGSAGLITLTWTDGKLSGDPDAVHMVQILAAGYEGKPVGNSLYGFTTHNHLSSPYTAYQLMVPMFSDHPRMLGNFPKIPSPPEGATP